MKKKNFLKGSLEDASYNIILQIMFRGVTFGMNIFVLRYISQDVIGVMNVRLLLLESTLLFLSREAFRRACVSQTTQHIWPQVINLIWLTVPICIVLCFIFGFVWLNILTVPESSVTQHYTIGVWSIAISCVMEMCCEPLYLVAQAFLFIRLKVVLESVIVFVRTVTFTCLIFSWESDGAVLAFSIAQLLSIGSYSIALYTYFWWYIKQVNIKRNSNIKKMNVNYKEDITKNLQRRLSLEEDFPFYNIKDFLPRKLENESPIDYKLFNLTWSFMKQGILKQILTDGERYIMTIFPLLSFSEQGTFDIVNNLGSLAARFLFRPIEESCYFYFSQVVQRDVTIRNQNQTSVKEASTVLRQVLRCVSSLGLIVLVFGQSYSKLLLLLYGGSSLATGLALLLLKTHCLAVLFLAINGTTECYALATMDTNQIDKYNRSMIFLSIAFLVTNWFFTMIIGSVGFILANCCNMGARIFQNVKYIHSHYTKTKFDPLRGLIPGPLFSISLVVSLIVTIISEIFLYDISKMYHFLVGVVCFIVVILCWIKEEKELVSLLYTKVRSKSD